MEQAVKMLCRKKTDYPGMKVSRMKEMEYLTFPIFEETGTVTHLVSTRLGGVSTGDCASLNFSYVDGLVTDVPGLILSTFYADCVPLLFFDPIHRAIGCSHSGWRGTVGEMGRVTVEAMEKYFGSRPEDILAAVGPSICRDCYEVGEEVAEEFENLFSGESGEVLTAKGNGKYLLDLWKANEKVLLSSGIRREHLAVTDICTCCNSEYLFSHRASRGKRGNIGAFIMLKP